MIKFKNVSVMNLENAMRGARNPLNSWGKGDSYYNENEEYVLGENDLSLAKRLCNAGSDHRKFIRQILVCVDIDAPLYWWKEYDTYKVATVANSCSTMHKIHSKEFTLDDFSHEQLDISSKSYLVCIIDVLNDNRHTYIETKDKQYWWNMIQLLPSSYNQLRTCTLNYETLRNIYHARKNHKLDEWHSFCGLIESLPYAKELIVGE